MLSLGHDVFSCCCAIVVSLQAVHQQRREAEERKKLNKAKSEVVQKVSALYQLSVSTYVRTYCFATDTLCAQFNKAGSTPNFSAALLGVHA
jgi:hypothetical protein